MKNSILLFECFGMFITGQTQVSHTDITNNTAAWSNLTFKPDK